MDPTWILSLQEYVTIAAQADGELTLLGLRSPITLRQLSPGLSGALRRLAAQGESAARLAEHVRTVVFAGQFAQLLGEHFLSDLADVVASRFDPTDSWLGQHGIANVLTFTKEHGILETRVRTVAANPPTTQP